jgi:hypothetical protein
MTILQPGDKVLTECHRVANFPFAVLKNKEALTIDKDNAFMSGGVPLASEVAQATLAFDTNGLTICSNDIPSPFGTRGSPLRAAVKIIEETPPPVPVDIYKFACNMNLFMWVGETRMIGGSYIAYRCYSPVVRWDTDMGATTYILYPCPWTPIGCTSTIGLPSTGCVCNSSGLQFRGQIAISPIPGNYNAQTGEIHGPLLTAVCSINSIVTGRTYTAIGSMGQIQAAHPMYRCPGVGTIAYTSATVTFQQSAGIAVRR